MEFNFDELLKEARNNIYDTKKAYEKLKDIKSKYQDLGMQIQEIIELVLKNLEPYSKEKKAIEEMYYEFVSSTSDIMLEKIRELCDEMNRNEGYKELISSIKDQQFRILELTRYLKRSEVFYIISRAFIINNKPMDKRLARIFNPFYPDELFKVLVYYFISRLTEKDETTNEEKITNKEENKS
jgi:uncharacterized UPF0160 family protein